MSVMDIDSLISEFIGHIRDNEILWDQDEEPPTAGGTRSRDINVAYYEILMKLRDKYSDKLLEVCRLDNVAGMRSKFKDLKRNYLQRKQAGSSRKSKYEVSVSIHLQSISIRMNNSYQAIAN